MAAIQLVGISKSFPPGGRSLFGLGGRMPTPAEPSRGLPGDEETGGKDVPGRGAPFALEHFSLKIPDGKTTAILGPSGCGKTTVLRIIAGLLEPDRGQVLFGEQDVTAVRPGDRRIGMVFQNYALYPHLTSEKNILSYFLFHRKTPELDELAHQKYERTSKLMGVDIAYLLDRKPSGLSQGEKQRVALARCITREPAAFLLDEPFSSLDQNLREKYRLNLKRLLNEFEITTVFVTHDQQEAMLLGDQIAVMERGKLVQVGAFLELYREPVNAFVAGFLNPDPLTPAINWVEGGRVASAFAGCTLGVRPEDVRLDRFHEGYGIELTVEDVVDLPTRPEILVSGRCGERRFHASVLSSADAMAVGRLWLRFERFHVFDAASGVRLQSYPGVGSDRRFNE